MGLLHHQQPARSSLLALLHPRGQAHLFAGALAAGWLAGWLGMTQLRLPLWVAAVGVLTAASLQQKQVPLPQPGVPQIMTMEGDFIRAAYNNEGYVILGYQLANRSIGEKWMLLEVGMTVRDGTPDYKVTRDKISLNTPDGKTIPLPSQSEYQQADLRALEMRERSSATRSTTSRRAPPAPAGSASSPS